LANIYDGAELRLTGDIAGDDVVTFGVDDGDTTTTAWSAGEGTLDLAVYESQTKAITTAKSVGVLMIEARTDETADTKAGAAITLASLDTQTSTVTETVVITGSNDLRITSWSADATASVLSASTMTGALTIGAVDKASTIESGSGNDSITSTAGVAFTVTTNDGNDTVSLTGNGTNTIGTGSGNDKVTAGTGNDTITLGTGVDTYTVTKGKDSVDLGSDTDADTITIGAGNADGTTHTTTLKNVTLGTDILVLTGKQAADIDVSDLSQTDSVYTLDTGTVVTLTGVTATDLSNTLRLGTSAANFVALDGGIIVAGSGADFITVAAGETTTVTLGGGADVFEVEASTGAKDSTVTDFVTGTDKIVLSGAATKDIDLGAAITPTKGEYDFGGNGEFVVTLTGHTETDVSSMFQLGDSKNAFTAVAAGKAVGGDYGDWISTDATTGGATVTGAGGADVYLLGGKGDTVAIASGDSTITAYDRIGDGTADTGSTKYTGTFTIASDVLDLDSTNLATVIGSTKVGAFTGITVVNGVITDWQGADLTLANLADALGFLAANIGSTDTVAFELVHDINGDGDGADANVGGVSTQDEYVSTFVFQSGAIDSVVELRGISGITALGTGAAANTIVLA